MTEWEPATETEAAMRDALRAGDQELYFRILARTDLLLPVSAEALAGRAPMGWGTWTTGGRTHVLAFTSTAALRACLAENAGSTRRAPYPDLAAGWPNPEWWLAVNPGLPIEGYLPAWFVSQLSRGDVRLPGRSMGARARLEQVERTARARATAAVPRRAPDGPRAEPEPAGAFRSAPDGRPFRPADPDGPGSGWPGTLRDSADPYRSTDSDRYRSPDAGPFRSPDAEPFRQMHADPFRQMHSHPSGLPLRSPGSSREPVESSWSIEGERERDPAMPPTGETTAVPPSPEPVSAPPSGTPATVPVIAPTPVRGGLGGDFGSQISADTSAGWMTPAGPGQAISSNTTNGSSAGVGAAAGPASSISAPPSDSGPSGPPFGPPPAWHGSADHQAGPPAPHQAGPPAPHQAGPPAAEPAGPPAAEPAGPPAAEPAGPPAGQPLDSPAEPIETGTAEELVSGAVAPQVPPSEAPPAEVWNPPAPRSEPSLFTPVARHSSGVPSPELADPPSQAGASPFGVPDPSSEPGVLSSELADPSSQAGVLSSGAADPSSEPVASSSGAGESWAGESWAGESWAGADADGATIGYQTAVDQPAGPDPASPFTAGAEPVEAAPAEVRPTEQVRTGTGLSQSLAGSPFTAESLTVGSFPTEQFVPGAAPTEATAGAPRSPSPTADPATTGPVAAEPQTIAEPPAYADRPAVAEPPAHAEPAPARRLVPEFVPANEVERSLLDAAGDGSTDTFLSTLLLARVLLPVAFNSAPGARPGDDGFEWRTELLDGERYVVVFTSPERLGDHLPETTDTVEVKFAQLIRRWPDDNYSFAVNPGTPVGAKLPGGQIVALANWAAEVGLGDDTGEPAPQAPVEEEVPRSTYAPDREDPGRPTIMQKTIAPSQLSYYLDRGYDRVSGFVHRASEVAHLRTPGKLHAALGLNHPGSPFDRDAEEIYVLRWPAYRPSLYRIPYGGQNEAAMRAMEGWVIERPPFRGNGFAPGESSDVVAEFKVDSVRLPHGAQLYRIGIDGAERLVATLDCDVPVWRRAEEG
ncbi:SseB family protein [Plantactinospora sp. B6F1]|uniref:SseB family protein n=1 Tax=Plantactinospora sp. B6F1 TaxID=3158971 RepID=UPI0032D999A9